MRGREGLTMDGDTRITWVLRPSQDAPRTRPQPVTVGISERREVLRAKLIAATVELAAEASHPRLDRTRHAPHSRIDSGFFGLLPRRPHAR